MCENMPWNLASFHLGDIGAQNQPWLLSTHLSTFFSGVDWKMTDVQIATKLRGWVLLKDRSLLRVFLGSNMSKFSWLFIPEVLGLWAHGPSCTCGHVVTPQGLLVPTCCAPVPDQDRQLVTTTHRVTCNSGLWLYLLLFLLLEKAPQHR